MSLSTALWPSPASLGTAGVLSVLASFVCFWGTSADVNCGQEALHCAGLFEVAVMAVIAGSAIALMLTAMAIVISNALSRIAPRLPSLEPPARAWPVAAALAVIHVALFGLLSLLGALPIGWLWPLGAFGVVGVVVPGNAAFRVQ